MAAFGSRHLQGGPRLGGGKQGTSFCASWAAMVPMLAVPPLKTVYDVLANSGDLACGPFVDFA
jgi:hypothetical protein